MLTKQEVLEMTLIKQIAVSKVGVIVQDITEIEPAMAVQKVAEELEKKLFVSIVNYQGYQRIENDLLIIEERIEDSILWRSSPECAGAIVTFILGESNKQHSLSDFSVITTRDLSEVLVAYCIDKQTNTPTIQYWETLRKHISDFTFDMLLDFANATLNHEDNPDVIPENMWRLGLLRDDKILGTRISVEDSFEKNRERIIDIGQLTEQSRKRLSSSLARAKDDKKAELKLTYKRLLEYFKYGKKETLKDLTMSSVEELWSATKRESPKPKPENNAGGDSTLDVGETTGEKNTKKNVVKKKRFDEELTESLLSEDPEEQAFVEEIEKALSQYYADEKDDSKPVSEKMDFSELQSKLAIGKFEGMIIDPRANNTAFQEFVGKVCNESAWGGLLVTDVPILKEAVVSQAKEFDAFDPTRNDSILSSSGIGVFEYLKRYDEKMVGDNYENVILFSNIIERLVNARKVLLDNIEMIMYHPVIKFGKNETAQNALFDYIDSWSELLKAYCVNEPILRQISIPGANFVARGLLSLDTVYIKTPTEWKGIILPLHPLYLWKYNCVFKDIRDTRESMSVEDLDKLAKVINEMPQLVNFLVVDRNITGDADIALPYAGQIEMLPRFENKTNRYMGNDGISFLEELLSRWINYAPYTRNEIRVAVADIPDLTEVIRILGDFIERYDCAIDLSVFFTHGQNGMFQLAQIDYDEKDHFISDCLRSGKLKISLHETEDAKAIREHLEKQPVHILYMFDQASFNIEYRPSSQNLYITPLVVTYDYSFDEINGQGSIYPSSEVESGMIGDYYKVMRFADIIQKSSVPRTVFNPAADLSEVNKMITSGATLWLAVADRQTSTYVPDDALTIGEKHAEHRNISIWTSSNSRFIKQYVDLLREFNLYPKREVLVKLFEEFGHITSEGLISIPRIGNNPQQIQNRKKGLIGTVFAAAWYVKKNPNALVASLDSREARLWLRDNDVSGDRADLIGLRYDEATDTLIVEPIEVKTRDDNPDASLGRNHETGGWTLDGHARDQVVSMQKVLKEIFALSENSKFDMFNTARREVLKYQIVSECFRKRHDKEWQKKWSQVLKRAFNTEDRDSINISIQGKLLHMKLSDSGAGIDEKITGEEGTINFVVMTSSMIQKEILEIEKPILPQWNSVDYEEGVDELSEEQEIMQGEVSQAETPVAYGEKIVKADFSDGWANIHKAAEDISYSTDTSTENQKTAISEKCGINENVHKSGVPDEEIQQLIKDFLRACPLRRIEIAECDKEKVVVGPGLIRVRFKLKRGQSLDVLRNQLDDIGREMKRSGLLVQPLLNSDELVLDIPRLQRDHVLYSDVSNRLPELTSIEQMWIPIGRTPEGEDIIKDLSEMPHLLIGGSTGSGKTVLLFSMLAAILKQHRGKNDIKLLLSSAGIEDFIHFEGLPQLIGGRVLTSAQETVDAIMNVVNKEFEERARIIATARVSNIIEYNKKCEDKLPPILVVIDEFADISDQLKKQERDIFFTTIRRIVQIGRKRGVHLVLCTQRPSANLVPGDIKAQLNGRIALRVNDSISSRMILEEVGAQELQKYGDMYLRYNNEKIRAQGYYISIEELDEIVEEVISFNS